MSELPESSFESEHGKFLKATLGGVSDIAKRFFGRTSKVSVKEGDNNQVLTEADLAIGQFIIEQIQTQFPEHSIIDEEAGSIDKKSEYTWVIDPIDGTANFAEGVPTFGTIMGLLHKDQPVAGGIVLPFFNEVVVAEKGKGAFCNGERLRVSKETRLLSSVVAYIIDGHQENPDLTYDECKVLADIILGVRSIRTSSSVFDAVMTAKGKYGAYINRTSKIWDNVGVQVVLEEAGGICTDFSGHPITYADPMGNLGRNFEVCMGAPALHTALQDIIQTSLRKITP